MEALARSIRENGILQPLTVRAARGGRYELILGERRLRAARMAGLTAVPCIVRPADDSTATLWSLLENLQRRALDFNGEAEGLRHLLAQTGKSLSELAPMLGLSENEAADMLRVLCLPEDVRRRLAEAGCTREHATALLRLPDRAIMRRAAGVICESRVSAADAGRLVTRILTPPEKIPVTLFKDVQIFITTIERAVEVMRRSGIEPDYARREDEDCAEFVIRIPKAARGGVRVGGMPDILV